MHRSKRSLTTNLPCCLDVIEEGKRTTDIFRYGGAQSHCILRACLVALMATACNALGMQHPACRHRGCKQDLQPSVWRNSYLCEEPPALLDCSSSSSLRPWRALASPPHRSPLLSYRHLLAPNPNPFLRSAREGSAAGEGMAAGVVN